ncbi:uncharacterized protein LOC107763365 [Nicotiana tabacum]|uniref:Uncharacterized protein LOC107763365 n=1 Tax=Nicotiana tabacum TaxID=4097 RepID=A0A1S3XBQ4_TOBAC|nr:PREDICTED: uncharacterized protein LOC107763365 [Nicotiana tabacum]
MPDTRRWKELAPKYGWKAKNHGLPQGFVTCPDVEVLTDPAEAARLLQEALIRSGALRSASGAGASSQSPQPENNQPKRQSSSSAWNRNKKIKKATPEPVTTTMVIDDDGEANDEEDPLQWRQRSSSAQHNAQSGELRTPIEGEVQAL